MTSIALAFTSSLTNNLICFAFKYCYFPLVPQGGILTRSIPNYSTEDGPKFRKQQETFCIHLSRQVEYDYCTEDLQTINVSSQIGHEVLRVRLTFLVHRRNWHRLTTFSMAPRICVLCEKAKAMLKRPKTGQQICRDCFFYIFETEVHNTITQSISFKPGDRVAIGASGGKGTKRFLFFFLSNKVMRDLLWGFRCRQIRLSLHML